jgi:hypothetical protein
LHFKTDATQRVGNQKYNDSEVTDTQTRETESTKRAGFQMKMNNSMQIRKEGGKTGTCTSQGAQGVQSTSIASS